MSGEKAGDKIRQPGLKPVLLSLLMPGLGFASLGQPLRGALVYLGWLLFCAATVAGVWFFGSFILRAVPILAAGWAYLEIALARSHLRAARAPGPHGPPALGLLLAAALALEVLPCVTLGMLADRLVGAAQVRDTGMLPRVAAGDTVVFERAAASARWPGRGDAVLLSAPDGHTYLRRVVAVPGDTVEMRGGSLVVNADTVPRQALGTIEATALSLPDSNTIHGFAEFHDRGEIQILIDSRVEDADLGPIELQGEYYFVLDDNRTAERAPDGRQFGLIDRRAVLGRPLHVLWSSDAAGVTWWRIGLPVE